VISQGLALPTSLFKDFGHSSTPTLTRRWIGGEVGHHSGSQGGHAPHGEGNYIAEEDGGEHLVAGRQ